MSNTTPDVDALIAQARALHARYLGDDPAKHVPAAIELMRSVPALLAALQTATDEAETAREEAERRFPDSFAGLLQWLDKHYPADIPLLSSVASKDIGPQVSAWARLLATAQAELGEAQRTITAIRALTQYHVDEFYGSANDYDRGQAWLAHRVLALLGPAAADPVSLEPNQETPCCMCQGTGRDFTYSEVDGTRDGRATVRVVRNVPTGRPCRACNGHGREPTALPPAQH